MSDGEYTSFAIYLYQIIPFNFKGKLKILKKYVIIRGEFKVYVFIFFLFFSLHGSKLPAGENGIHIEPVFWGQDEWVGIYRFVNADLREER